MKARLLRRGVALALLLGVGAVASEEHRIYDLTAEHTLTLTDETVSVLHDLDRGVEITAFLRRDEPGRVEAATLLDRYRKENRRIQWNLEDPDEAPGDAGRLGIDPALGGVAVQIGDEIELAPSATEQDLTAALTRLLRGRGAVVCFASGHGEVSLLAATEILERDGYDIELVDLLARAEVPPECTAMVLAGPSSPLGAAGDALAAWIQDDGKLLVLADPAANVDLSGLLGPVGLRLLRGLVFEGDPAAVIGGDATAPIVRTYSSGHPIVRRLAPTYFPGVQGIEVDEAAADRVPGLTVSRLADSSPAGYLETEPVAARFDPELDVPGPITVAAAADRSSNDGQEIRRSRVVVVGDADFATDRFVGEAANADLFRRAVGWLTLGEDLAAISPNLPVDRPLRLTDARLTYARLLTAAVVPALFVLAGAMVWAARRHR